MGAGWVVMLGVCMPTTSRLQYRSDSLPSDYGTLVVVGRKERLLSDQIRAKVPVPQETWTAMLQRVEGGDWGASVSTYVGSIKVVAGVLPERCSRHSPPARTWAIPKLAAAAAGKAPANLILAVDGPEHAFAACVAAAKAFPLYSQRSGTRSEQLVSVQALAPGGAVFAPKAQAAMEGVQMAAELVDMPTSTLDTDAFVARARAVAEELDCRVEVIRGEAALKEAGLGGIWGVGKAAEKPPALVALVHNPDSAERTIAWVGKGIVYDTGGLSIKSKTGMPGMKGDMGGAAAVLAAFRAAVKTGFDQKLVAVLCLADNAVGPKSVRPDDILAMHSGRSVEVNNTDAEGRLVLADGVSWVSRKHRPELIVDLATLTGAALMTTGKIHAGIYANDLDLETRARKAGMTSGEAVYPFLYAPELLRKEFKSSIADLKNSVKDRMNAQASCAALFIESHLPTKDTPRFLHVDIAGPAWSGGRGTGYGVGLLMALGDQ